MLGAHGSENPTLVAHKINNQYNLLEKVDMTVSAIFFPPMALTALIGPWLFFSSVIIFYTDGRTPWTSDKPVTRPLPIHRTTQTQNKRIHGHPCLE
jgi:hypothetical protein